MSSKVGFNYDYGQAEDLARLLIVVPILATGIYVGYESITRLIGLPEIDYIWVVAVAAIIGFIGNEAVALIRMKIGKEIASAALVADGHARPGRWTDQPGSAFRGRRGLARISAG